MLGGVVDTVRADLTALFQVLDTLEDGAIVAGADARIAYVNATTLRLLDGRARS